MIEVQLSENIKDKYILMVRWENKIGIDHETICTIYHLFHILSNISITYFWLLHCFFLRFKADGFLRETRYLCPESKSLVLLGGIIFIKGAAYFRLGGEQNIFFSVVNSYKIVEKTIAAVAIIYTPNIPIMIELWIVSMRISPTLT